MGTRENFSSICVFSYIHLQESGQKPAEFTQAFGTRSFNGVPKPVYRAMQLIKRLGTRRLPVTQQSCFDGNCTANLTVTSNATGSGFEALLINHPTGVVNMRSPPTLSPLNVTVKFKGKMPSNVSIRRVDADHANALALYQASA